MHTCVRSPLRLAHLALGALTAALLLAACGGGGGGGSGLGCFNAGVVVLSGTAPVVANPSAINVCQGGTVHFQNNTGAPVQIDSNGACSEIDMTAPIAAGAASTPVTMPALGTCSFHTAADASTAIGTISVVTVPVGGGY